MELLQQNASLPEGSGQCNFCNALPHCLETVGSATPRIHCLAAWGQWAMQLFQNTASAPEGNGQCASCNALPHCQDSGQCYSCNTLPHCPGGVGNATRATHCLAA